MHGGSAFLATAHTACHTIQPTPDIDVRAKLVIALAAQRGQASGDVVAKGGAQIAVVKQPPLPAHPPLLDLLVGFVHRVRALEPGPSPQSPLS